MDKAALREFLQEKQIAYREGEPLSKHTSFRIGGAAAFFAQPDAEEQLADLLDYGYERALPFALLGNGSNLLAPDQGFDGLMISTMGLNRVEAAGLDLVAGSGVLLSRLASAAYGAGLTGLEFAQGIPGSVGGAVFMNAGAYGGDMGQVVARVRYYERGAVRAIEGEALAFGYRQSYFQRHPHCVVLSATFRLTPGNQEEIQAKMAEYAARRREKQPLELPSAGSAFRRPQGRFAGQLIEQCGLKGYRVGGAQVSEKHAGFIVNLGGATAEDVRRLLGDVVRRVREQTGVELEPEIRELKPWKV